MKFIRAFHRHSSRERIIISSKGKDANNIWIFFHLRWMPRRYYHWANGGNSCRFAHRRYNLDNNTAINCYQVTVSGPISLSTFVCELRVNNRKRRNDWRANCHQQLVSFVRNVKVSIFFFFFGIVGAQIEVIWPSTKTDAILSTIQSLVDSIAPLHVHRFIGRRSKQAAHTAYGEWIERHIFAHVRISYMQRP